MDDEPPVLRTLLRVLRRRFDVVGSGGGDVLEILRTDRTWDAIVCDLERGSFDSADLHAWLAERDPGLAERVLFCTAGAMTERMGLFLRSHSGRVLKKPFGAADLFAALDPILDARSAQRS